MNKIYGLNYDIDDGYYCIFDKTALKIGDGHWMHRREGTFNSVLTENIYGGMGTCFAVDRRLGLIDKIAGVEMNPEFTLLMLQQGGLQPEMFANADEGNDWISLPPAQLDADVYAEVRIIRDLPVSMRTVDIAGAAL